MKWNPVHTRGQRLKALEDAVTVLAGRLNGASLIGTQQLGNLEGRLRAIETAIKALSDPATRRVGFNVVGLVPRGPKPGGPMLEISCDTESKARVRIVPKTKSGAPAAIQSGSLTVTTQDGDGVATLEDDTTFTIQGTALADSTFLVSGDADLGDGVETISDTILLHTTSAKAENLGLTQVEIVPR